MILGILIGLVAGGLVVWLLCRAELRAARRCYYADWIARFKDEGPKAPTHFGAMTSLVTPQYHFISHQTQGTQLYDWIKDPGENANLVQSPAEEPAADAMAEEIRARTSRPR